MFVKSCDLGHADGCQYAGNAFEQGRGVAMSRPRALELLERACDLFAGPACVQVAGYYEQGWATPANKAFIAAWKKEVRDGRNPREIKVIFAREIVTRFHDAAAAVRAAEDFDARHKAGAMPEDMPQVELATGGTPMLCLHGGAVNAHWFDFVAPGFTANYHVRSLDQRGHGDSAWAQPPDYSYARYAADVAEVVEKLDLRDFVLMGHSMGGAIAFHVAVMAPERVKTLALVSSAGVISPTPSELWRLNWRS